MEPKVPEPGSAPSAGAPIPDTTESDRLDRLDAGRHAISEKFTTFYRDAVPKIVSILIRKGAKPDEAAEAAQEALTRALHNWATIKTNQLSWCITTAERYHWDRKYSAVASYEDIPPNSILLADPASDVLARVVARLRLEETVHRLPALTTRQHEVLVLHLSGLTITEIATHLALAAPTVRVHLTNIRRILDEPTPADQKHLQEDR